LLTSNSSVLLVINGPATTTPVMTPSGGTFSAATTVTLTDSTPGAVIYCANITPDAVGVGQGRKHGKPGWRYISR
jgi:hypothetical protein